MDEGQVIVGIVVGVLAAIILAVAINVGTEASCRSDAIAAGMKGAEVKEACK